MLSMTYIEKQERSSISKEINGVGSTSGNAGIMNAEPSKVIEPSCTAAGQILI